MAEFPRLLRKSIIHLGLAQGEEVLTSPIALAKPKCSRLLPKSPVHLVLAQGEGFGRIQLGTAGGVLPSPTR